MKIRVLTINEIKSALDLVWNVFCEFEAPDYSDVGIETFRDFIEYDSIVKQVTNGDLTFYGYFGQTELLGVLAVKPNNHICMLFVKKEFHRMGVGRQLFEHYKFDNSSDITVNSSPFAIDFYHKLGFTDTSTEQLTDGIKYTSMIYSNKQ